MDYNSKKVVELREILKKKKLKTTGNKDVLVKRLVEYDKIEITTITIQVVSGKTYNIKYHKGMTVSEIKHALYELTTYSPKNQILYRVLNRRTNKGDIVLGEKVFGKVLGDDDVVNGEMFVMHCKF